MLIIQKWCYCRSRGWDFAPIVWKKVLFNWFKHMCILGDYSQMKWIDFRPRGCILGPLLDWTGTRLEGPRQLLKSFPLIFFKFCMYAYWTNIQKLFDFQSCNRICAPAPSCFPVGYTWLLEYFRCYVYVKWERKWQLIFFASEQNIWWLQGTSLKRLLLARPHRNDNILISTVLRSDLMTNRQEVAVLKW